ncbi:MAG: helix-turn-helix transcriptional regulator [Actinobacteria bacterium]|nr:helix-turn-helix transcriptional regulator [Actinomycetota bacterium]
MSKTDSHPVYIISIAAKLAKVHPQTLRIYERKGLLAPSRTRKKRRMYSDEDIECLGYIQELTQKEKVNLAGVKIIMELREEIKKMEEFMETKAKEFDAIKEEMEREINSLHRRFSPKLEKAVKGIIVKF